MEEGSVPGLGVCVCVYGGMYVFEDENLASVCVSTSMYRKAYLCVS